ncbi:MAG: A/G-specific adenine glycosylase [Clostridia bacterium]|nr:A/G-specific adenine glycosylase [Clostridia bacterium]
MKKIYPGEVFMNEIIPLLLQWYETVRRPLPWRDSPTPYHVWISEIMLQQTRIEAVLPYYRRFLEELPAVSDLAAVSDDRLMKLWEGLGYYSRARNLKKAAQVIVSAYGGELPGTADELRGLPGIGDYTAGAVASIAFGQPEPAVDGNVLRVYSRITASAEDIALDKTKKSVREELRKVYPSGEDAAMLTEALMELGETVCVPNAAPKCEICPVKEHCQAHLTGTTDDYPVKSGKKARRIEPRTVLLLRCGDRYAVRKRPSGGLLAEMWEFPNTDSHLSAEEAVEKCGFSGKITDIRPLGTAKHIFSHVEWHMIGYEVTAAEEDAALIWADAETIRETYAIPSAFRYFSGLLK